jgi:hypothetical protein
VPKISTLFKLNKTQPQLDFVDVDTDGDIDLYVDPYAFAHALDDWSIRCHHLVVNYFEAVIEAINANKGAEGRALLNHLHEPNETSLGLSKGRPSGRGVGSRQAEDIYEKLVASKAAKTGLLSELTDCELFVKGIGPDKISDITTNIIRGQLVTYTQRQCALHGIEMRNDVPTGVQWDMDNRRWFNVFADLPVIDNRMILLVPKSAVRWSIAFSHSAYYNNFVLTYLQAEHLNQRTALVETLKGRPRVTKKKLKEHYPLTKDFLAAFSSDHPDVLARYKKLMGISRKPTNSDLQSGFDERAFAKALRHELAAIPPGDQAASRFHSFMVGALEFIFYPHLIYPQKEVEINQGRKRIDIMYTNDSESGFFYRRKGDAKTTADQILVECKNYSSDMKNPELDQMAGRFAKIRGRLGFLIGRTFDDRQKFTQRCRDTAHADQGFIIALVDEDIDRLLDFIEKSARPNIDEYLEQQYRKLIA